MIDFSFFVCIDRKDNIWNLFQMVDFLSLYVKDFWNQFWSW